MLFLVYLPLLALSAAPAQLPASASAFPGGTRTPSGTLGIVAVPNHGIVALNLTTGDSVWKRRDVLTPLIAGKKHLLVDQVDSKGLRLTLLDVKTGKTLKTHRAVAVPFTPAKAKSSFESQACLRGDGVLHYSWWTGHRTRTGRFKFDLGSGHLIPGTAASCEDPAVQGMIMDEADAIWGASSSKTSSAGELSGRPRETLRGAPTIPHVVALNDVLIAARYDAATRTFVREVWSRDRTSVKSKKEWVHDVVADKRSASGAFVAIWTNSHETGGVFDLASGARVGPPFLTHERIVAFEVVDDRIFATVLRDRPGAGTDEPSSVHLESFELPTGHLRWSTPLDR